MCKCKTSRSGREYYVFPFPRLYLEVTKEGKLEDDDEDDDSSADTAEFQLFVELVPSREQCIAFEGNLDKWKKFIQEIEKQLTCVMKKLERKDESFLTNSEKWRLEVYKQWEPFLKNFSESSQKVEALLSRSSRNTKVLFWDYLAFLKSTAILFCALPWHWIDHNHIPDFNDASSVVEMLEVLQVWLVLSLAYHPGQFSQMNVFLEA